MAVVYVFFLVWMCSSVSPILYTCTYTRDLPYLMKGSGRLLTYPTPLKNGTASARTSDPGASIGRVRGRTIQMRERISRQSRCEA
jgi:hypothetical protein